jgi:hypothetical protein
MRASRSELFVVSDRIPNAAVISSHFLLTLLGFLLTYSLRPRTFLGLLAYICTLQMAEYIFSRISVQVGFPEFFKLHIQSQISLWCSSRNFCINYWSLPYNLWKLMEINSMFWPVRGAHSSFRLKSTQNMTLQCLHAPRHRSFAAPLFIIY